MFNIGFWNVHGLNEHTVSQSEDEDFLSYVTSVVTEMCCPKGKCGCQYFILLTLKKKKNSWTQGPGFFNKTLILDYYFCLKSGPVFLFQIFIIAPSQGI
jgi:hypothetical protein